MASVLPKPALPWLQPALPCPGADLADFGVLDQGAFHYMLQLEQKRTERSERPFVLMRIEGAARVGGDISELLDDILRTLVPATRDTDIKGWYKRGAVVGVIFTEIGNSDGRAVAKTLLNKITAALSADLGADSVDRVKISCQVFPENWDTGKNGDSSGKVLQPDLLPRKGMKISFGVKRMLDVGGSLVALLLLGPLMTAIAVAVKLTSKGPVFFKQERVGQFGRGFTFLKFRSMRSNNDSSIHEEFVKRLIAGNSDNVQKVYKLVNDPRVTRIGRFLRRTSLDELPQFFNVLKGDMSLVGPRPPIPYEVRCYDLWHKRRLSAVKPGITGLWQVAGRSRVGFDDMVRLDLRYAKSWSLWLDLKILLQTPRAVLGGEGAC